MKEVYLQAIILNIAHNYSAIYTQGIHKRFRNWDKVQRYILRAKKEEKKVWVQGKSEVWAKQIEV